MNRQSRALLIILIAGVVFVPYCLYRPGGWLASRVEPPPSRLLPPEDPPPTRGGTITGSQRSEPASFNRLMSPNYTVEIFSRLTQGRLVRLNRLTQEVEPALAEKWAVSADGRAFTLTLRDGVTWSDGTPFTSADVLFTFEAIADKSTASTLASLITAAGAPLTVTAPDARTVVITYPRPFAPGVRQLDVLPIMPKHKLEPALRAGTLAKAWSAATPPADLVGLGPFVLSRYEPGRRLVYDRNPRYWRRDERGQQLPYADRIVLEIVPDQSAETLRLHAGELDVVNQQLPAQDVAATRTLADQGKLRLFELGVSVDPDSFLFNLRPAYWEQDPRREWLPRREFRQAISHAVDREAFAETVFLGEGVPVHGPITPGNTKWFWPDITRYEHSADKARALLRGLGLDNRDSDEWLEDAQGRDARFTVLVFGGATVIERSAAFVRDELKKIGVAVDIVSLEPNTVIKRVGSGDFDAAMLAFQADLDPALNKDFWISSGLNHLWHPSQPSPATDWERQIDELMMKQSSTFDENERKRLFNEVQRLFAEHLPVLHFAAPKIWVAAGARLINLQPAINRPQLLWTPDTIAVRDAKPAS